MTSTRTSKILLTIILTSLVLSCGSRTPSRSRVASDHVDSENIQNITKRFDEINAAGNFTRYLTSAQSVPWGAGYVMQAYATMYQGTNDLKYLKLLGEFSLGVLKLRSDVSGEADPDGVIRAVWLTNFYGQLDGYLVTTGMATYPMAEFVRSVYEKPGLRNQKFTNNETYGDVAKKLEKAIAETFAAHEEEWDEKEGTYRFSKANASPLHSGRILPLNQYIAFARTLIVMGKTLNNKIYLERAAKMGGRFKSMLVLNEAKDAYSWKYWPEVTGALEDFSHGAIDIDFVSLSHEHKMGIFNDTDLRRFANCLKLMNIGPLKFSQYVTGIGTAGTPESLAMYMGLSAIDPAVYSMSKKFFEKTIDVEDDTLVPAPVLTLIGLANIKRYQR